MKTTTKERKLTTTEKRMLRQASAAALSLLSLTRSAKPEKIATRIEDFVEGLFSRKVKNLLGEDAAMALGALWGEAICIACGWEWVVAQHGRWKGLGIADSERRYLALPLSYFTFLLANPPKDIHLPSLQLYNCITKGNMPKSNPRDYTIVSEEAYAE